MKKKLLIAVGLMVSLFVALFAWNYLSIWQPVSEALAKDRRNSTIEVRTHYQYAINPNVLVFDLRSFSVETSQIDIMRVLFQTADSVRDKSFEKVILAYKGTAKFSIPGTYFQTIGKEYSWQNPIVLTRTFAQNVTDLQGKKAFSTWTGGVFAVMKNQLDDLGALHRQWYLDDWISSTR